MNLMILLIKINIEIEINDHYSLLYYNTMFILPPFY